MHATRNYFVTSVLALIVLAFVTSFTFFASTERAHAQDAVSVVQSINTPILNGILASSASLTLKETSLDGIAWAVAKLVIQNITQSIVDWINSGFDGNPAFVTDLDGYLKDIADQVVGSFIEGSELSFLCDPFELDIRAALALEYGSPFTHQVECRLSDVTSNIDNFIDGDFRDGGWDAWFELTINDNPYKRYIEASSELEARIGNAQDNELNLLAQGNGFLAWRECRDGTGASVPNTEAHRGDISCEIVTPGVVIESQLEQTLGVGLQQLSLADEINEIIGALIAQLAQQVLTDGGGLRGVSQSRFGESPYTSRLNNDRSSVNEILINTQRPITDEVDRITIEEQKYRNAVQSGLTPVLSVESLNEELRLCDPSAAQSFSATITLRKNVLLSGITLVDQILFELQSIRSRVLSATTPSDVDRAGQELTALVGSERLHTPLEITAAQAESTRIAGEMELLREDVQNAITTCNSGGGEN